MIWRSRYLSSAFFLLAVAASGCGDDDGASEADRVQGSEQSRAPSLSVKQYAAKGDEICGDARQEIESLRREYLAGKGNSPEAAMEFARKASDELGEAIGRLRALPPPNAKRSQAQALVAAAQSATAVVRKASEDEDLARQLFHGEDPFAGASGIARALGMRSCASASR